MAQTRIPKAQLDTTLIDTTSSQSLSSKDLTAGTNTFPTLNQNTTGSAAKWTTARNLAGNSVDGSANVQFANNFIVQGTTDSGLSGAQFLGSLSTGLVKNTNTTGVLSIATAGSDYQAPLTLTTTGTSGAATLVSNTLNIPQYSGGTGDVVGPSSATNNAFVIFDGTTGKLVKDSSNIVTSGSNLTSTVGTLSLSGSNGTVGVAIQSNMIIKSSDATISSAGTGVSSITTNGGTQTLTNKTLTAPTLTTPALGTPASGIMTNVTGTASGLTAGNVTTNANLTGPITSVGNATSIASQTGTGTKFVVDTSPTLVTPNLGVATATSINKVTITAPATSATLSLITGSTLATAGAFSTTLTATAATNVTLPTSGTLYGTASGSISSSQLATSLSDETGTGVSVFSTSPLLTTPNIAGASSPPSTPTTGQGILFGVGTGAVRPHWMSSSGTDETIVTNQSTALVGPSVLATGATSASVATFQSTSSTSYTDLTTVGPSVTVTIGTNGLAHIILSCYTSQNTVGGYASMGFAASGANTISAALGNALAQQVSASSNNENGSSWSMVLTGLTAGSTTFTAKYSAVTSGTASFRFRTISVIPL